MEKLIGTWPANVKSWEIVEVEKLNQLKLVIWLTAKGPGWEKDFKWEQFFLTKDGNPNKKTYGTLETLGFVGSDIGELITDPAALDKVGTYSIDVVSEKIDDKTYYRVEWINSLDRESKGKVSDVKELKGKNLAKLNSFLKKPTKPQVKNHAPTFDQDEELPF